MRIGSIMALSSAALVATTALASAFPGEQLASHARVTIAQARATALRTVHGKIKSEELEKEAGGSGLRYTFDIATSSGIREVGVDAKTGAVLENAPENANAASSQASQKGANEPAEGLEKGETHR